MPDLTPQDALPKTASGRVLPALAGVTLIAVTVVIVTLALTIAGTLLAVTAIHMTRLFRWAGRAAAAPEYSVAGNGLKLADPNPGKP